MRACPSCYALNEDAAATCSACQTTMLAPATTAKGKPFSDAAALAAEARQRYQDSAPTSADLSPQAWYNLAKFYPTIARKAAELRNRPLPNVGLNNPLDRTARAGFARIGTVLAALRTREPGEDDE